MSSHSRIIENLSRTLKPTSKVRSADAAVALLLRPANQHFRILLAKRIKNPSDPWSGQMAFPGGKHNPEDEDTKQTVIRETLEETNINLAHDCRFLGTLENIRTTLRPDILVAPFVVFLKKEPIITLSKELEEYMWVPLKKFPKCKGTATFPFGEVPAYLIEGHVIWGLTYRILEKFIKILENVASRHLHF